MTGDVGLGLVDEEMHVLDEVGLEARDEVGSDGGFGPDDSVHDVDVEEGDFSDEESLNGGWLVLGGEGANGKLRHGGLTEGGDCGFARHVGCFLDRIYGIIQDFFKRFVVLRGIEGSNSVQKLFKFDAEAQRTRSCSQRLKNSMSRW